MALITDDEFKKQTTKGLPRPNKAEQVTSTSDALFAAFDIDNTVFNVTKRILEPTVTVKPEDINYNPYDNDGEDIKGYEDYAEEFLTARNLHDVELTKVRIDHELEQRDKLANATGMTQLFGSLSANIVDPLAFVPLIKGIQTANKSKQIASGILQGSAYTTSGEALREAILQSTQNTRSTEESIFNIAAAGIMGGVLGGVVGGITPSARSAARSILSKNLEDKGLIVDVSNPNKPQVARSAGAAASKDITDDELANLNEQLAKTISGPKWLRSPTLRGLTSRSATVKAITNRLFQHNFITKGNVKGEAIEFVAEKVYRRDMNELQNAINQVNNLYLQHTGVGQVKSLLARPEGKISKTEFNTRVSRVLHTGIADDLNEVNSASKLYRGILDKYKKQLQELNLIADNVDPNYLSRIYKVNYLHTTEGQREFQERMGNWLLQNNIDGTPRNFTGSQAELSEVVEKEIDDLLSGILREKDQQLAFETFLSKERTGSSTKATKSRTINAPYEVLEPFLETDVDLIMKHYVNRASGTVNTHKALDQYLGSADAKVNPALEIKKAIKAERDIELEKIRLAKKQTKEAKKLKELEKEEQAILDEYKEAEQLASTLYKAATGSLRKVTDKDKYLETLLKFNYTRLLGGVTLGSLSELAMPIFSLGFKEFGSNYLAAIKNMKAFSKATEQLKDMNVGLDLANNNILRMMGDTGFEAGRYTSNWERSMDVLVQGFSTATGIEHFTQYGRVMAGHMALSKIIRTLEGKVSAEDTAKLAQTGIPKRLHKAILNEFKTHGDKLDGSYIPNLHLWKNQEAREAFVNSVQNFIDSTIITPGRGDLPFFAQESVLGKVIFQFKPFMAAATNKVLLRGLQTRDAQVYLGAMTLVAFGALSQAVNDVVANRKTETDPSRILADGISRSGLAGLIGTSLLDAGRSLTSDTTRRFGVDFASAFLGPSASLINELSKTTQRLSDGKVSDADTRQIMRLLPLQNLHILNYLKNRLYPKE